MNQRVCGDINIGCCNFSSSDSSSCGICNNKLNYNKSNPQMSRNHCPNRTVLGILNQNGTFAEYMILPLVNLHVVPEGIADEIAVFAEPLAAACRVVEQGFIKFSHDEECNVRGGDRVAILGDGKLGLCIAEILGREYLKAKQQQQQQQHQHQSGVAPHPPILFGKHQHKLDLVSDSGVQCRLVNECYTNDDNDKAEAQEEQKVSSHHANQYDVVIDSTGNPNGLILAMTLCRPMGRLVLKSTCAAGVKGFNSAPIVIDELQVVGSRCGPIDTALELLEGNSSADTVDGVVVSPPLRMEKYITETFPLCQVRDALECAAKKTTMKVQLVMGTSSSSAST
jgi:threonine dehydrogenase-like Zn-dependent dehydrogenase